MKIDSRDLWAKISVSSRNDCLPENHRRFRRSHPEVIVRKGVLKKCGKFTGGHPCPSVISIKLLCNFHCVKSDQNTEFFLVRIFQHSDWIRRDAPYFSVFSPNAGKYGPEKTRYFDTFHAALLKSHFGTGGLL